MGHVLGTLRDQWVNIGMPLDMGHTEESLIALWFIYTVVFYCLMNICGNIAPVCQRKRNDIV